MKTSQAKPFDIPKQLVWEAYRQVAANQGAPGVDQQTIGEFEARLKDNLYKILARIKLGVLWPPRSRRWRYQNPTEGGPGCSACPRSLTGWPRRWWPFT